MIAVHAARNICQASIKASGWEHLLIGNIAGNAVGTLSTVLLKMETDSTLGRRESFYQE